MATAVAEKNSDKFLYDQVSNHVLELVDSGVLKPGDKAPSLRKLSQQLRVSITTVSQGYALLAERGVLESRPQSGFYVNTVVNQPDLPRKTTTLCRPRKVRFGELFEEVFNVANDPDVVPLGASVQPLRGTDSIMWTIKFRNGNMKRFKFPIRTTPEGSIQPYASKPEAVMSEVDDHSTLFTKGTHSCDMSQFAAS